MKARSKEDFIFSDMTFSLSKKKPFEYSRDSEQILRTATTADIVQELFVPCKIIVSDEPYFSGEV